MGFARDELDDALEHSWRNWECLRDHQPAQYESKIDKADLDLDAL